MLLFGRKPVDRHDFGGIVALAVAFWEQNRANRRGKLSGRRVNMEILVQRKAHKFRNV